MNNTQEKMEDYIGTFTPNDWVTSDATIKVLGVGGGGCNAVNHMFEDKIEGCTFIVCNTDSQALSRCSVPTKIQLGRGLGAGTDPTRGRNAALEAQERIEQAVFDDKIQMLFVTAGMGGGTGTGATPVIAKMSKDRGILTVGVVTLPFKSEGSEVYSRAIDGLRELEKNVDSLLVINNEKLFMFGDKLAHEAFPMSDNVLCTAVRSIIEIIKKPGYINVDFQDVKTMMSNSGMALMGIGVGNGENRIDDALSNAFESPLMNDFDLKSARKVLVNVTAAKTTQDITMGQYKEITDKIADYTGGANNFKSGLIWEEDPEFGDSIRVTAIATGFKFSSVLGDDVNLGNIIKIGRDFVYDRQKLARQEGIPMEVPETGTIGFNSKARKGTFIYDAQKAPMMLNEEMYQEVETTPSIRRIQK